MQRAIAGIDLGTTNSVIAIPGEFPDKGVVFGSITVVWDSAKRLTHASAVCQSSEGLKVGDDAKQMAELGFTPVRFVKKYMGTDTRFRVGDKNLLPEEVSAMVLQYLCSFAAKSLQLKIDTAVITHPAYFDGLAIRAAQRAGELAGLKVAKLIMEPVAALMAHATEDERPSSRDLVYDLGGGTFDITLMTRNGRVFRPEAFGGDRELGGYNIDKVIATLMLALLRSQGYVLLIDPEHPERDARWSALMYFAEQLKCSLGDGDETAQVNKANVFLDDSKPPKQVQLSFSMTQEQFVLLIEPFVLQTLRATREVLKKSNTTLAQVDSLILVGGSCRIQALQRRLQTEFGKKPQFDDDVLDLSVAVGAAMVAESLGMIENDVSIKPLPEATPETRIQVSGEILANEDRPVVAKLLVTVSGGKQGDVSQLSSADGRFALDVELHPNASNQITCAIEDQHGNEIYRHEFAVVHDPRAVRTTLTPPSVMLSKPISVMTTKGLVELAAEGVTLPYAKTDEFRTQKDVTELPVRVYQENVQLADMRIAGFSRPVPANSIVEVTISIAADYSMKVLVNVPAAKLSKEQSLQLYAPVVPPIDVLRYEFKQAIAQYRQQLEYTPDGPVKAKIGIEADRVIEEAEALLGVEMVERLQVFMLINRLVLLTRQLPSPLSLSPPKSRMDEAFVTARELLASQLATRPHLREQAYDRMLDTLQQEADQAYQQSDSVAWQQVDRRLKEIMDQLEPPAPPPPTITDEEMKEMLEDAITETEERLAEHRSRIDPTMYQSFNQNLSSARQQCASVALNAPGAQQKLRGIYHKLVKPAGDFLDNLTGAPRPGGDDEVLRK